MLLLEVAGEESRFQRVQLAGDVVLAVEVAVVEDLGENLFGQDVLDQHLAHVGIGEAGVDGLLRMLQELRRRLRERRRCRCAARSIIVAQRLQHGRQVGLELLDGLAEVGDLGALVAEEQLEQLFQRLHVGHWRSASPLRGAGSARPGCCLRR